VQPAVPPTSHQFDISNHSTVPPGVAEAANLRCDYFQITPRREILCAALGWPCTENNNKAFGHIIQKKIPKGSGILA
jgi:hypothetical protein